MKNNITIIGTGYVGLTTGACFAHLGHNVICVDKDEGKIKSIMEGNMPIFEPGIKEIIINAKKDKNIRFTTDINKAVNNSELIFIAVGTPFEDKKGIDMTYFKSAIREIAKNINKYSIIINKSTVPVGTGEWTKKEIGKYYKGDFAIVSNPEFLSEGNAINDFMNPDRVVIGVEDKKSEKIMRELYSFVKNPKIIVDIRSAEMIKYAANAFLATKISFINEIANICEKTGGDIVKISEGIGLDKRIGKFFLNAGLGYGGSCFPKDIAGLLSISNNHKHNFKLLKEVSNVNQKQQLFFLERIKEIIKKNKGNTVSIWGLSFKPNTDDVRKSPAIFMIEMLAREGLYIRAYDPVAIDNAKKEIKYKKISFYDDPIETAKGSDVLVLVTDWPCFLRVDMNLVKENMRNPYFLDGRNQFNPEKIRKLGFSYKGIGRN